jgi:FkbM family methyltransferase
MSIVTRGARRVRELVTRPFLLRRMQRLGITFYPPNYVYVDRFGVDSIVVDVGCGYEAEFSRHMIERHGLHAVGVDPTRKHAPALAVLVRESVGRFTHLPLAVTCASGTLTFHESRENESGSVLPEHTNVRNDHTTSYEVDTIDLMGLARRIGRDSIDFLKLDLEGAEYDLLHAVEAPDVAPFGQIFVEFHHHCTDHSPAETLTLVERLAGFGFDVFTLDRHNYLFYRRVHRGLGG